MNSLQSFPEKSFPKIKEKLRLSASSAGTLQVVIVEMSASLLVDEAEEVIT